MSDDDNRENPFVGLRPFFDEDSFYFFGRNDQVTELLELLHGTHFVPVLGSSGSGKSSLVRAGLIPTLRAGFMVAERDGWRMAKCLPGDAPIENLAEALLRAVGVERTPAVVHALATRIREDADDAVIEVLGPHLTAHESVLILVDQFEELFAFRGAAGAESDDDPDTAPDAARTTDRLRRRRDASLLVSLLLALAERTDIPVYVVTTMRTDFLGDCDIFTGLPEAINRSGYLVPSLSRAQLRSAIEGPARLVGARAAPRLVDRILNDVGDRMDRLPLMQHALRCTFEAWKSAGMMGPIDLTDLEKIGGLDRALDVQAEATIVDIDPVVAERVFKRLTAIDRNQRRVRHPTRLSDLRAVAGSENAAALTTLLDRCVSEGTNFMFASADGQPNDPRYNITHESLIRQWDRLRKWVDEEQAQRDWFFGVASRASLYAGDADTGLMSRRDLRITQELVNERAPDAGWAARYPEAATSFDDAMRYVRASAKHAKAVRRNWVIGAAAILILVVGGTIKVLRSGELAKAALAAVDDVGRDAAIERLLSSDPTYAAALAAEMTDTLRWTPARISLLQRALNSDHATAEFRNVADFVIDASGTEVALGYDDGHVDIRDIDGVGEPRAVFRAPASDSVLYLKFVKDGGVVVAYRNGAIRLWRRGKNPSTSPQTTPERSWQSIPLRLLDLAADSITLIAVDDSSSLFTWSVRDSVPRRLLPNAKVRAVYVHPTDPRIVVANTSTERDAPDSLHVVDVPSGTIVRTLKGIDRSIDFVSFKDSTDELLVGQYRGPVMHFKRDAIVAMYGDSAGNVAAQFNRHFDAILVSTEFGYINIYNIADGTKTKSAKPVQRLLAHEEAAYSKFSRDGHWIISWSSDGSIRWTATVDTSVSIKVSAHPSSIFRVDVAASGSRILSQDNDGTVRVWRAPSITQAIPFSLDPLGPRWIVLADNGESAVAGYLDGTISVHTLGDSSVATKSTDAFLNLSVSRAGISPSGRTVFAEAGPNRKRWLWHVGEADPIAIAGAGTSSVSFVNFSYDDSVLVLASQDGELSFYDVATGKPKRASFKVDGEVQTLAVSPVGGIIAAAVDTSVLLFAGDSVTTVTRDLGFGTVTGLTFSPDGTVLLMTDESGAADLVHVAFDGSKAVVDTSSTSSIDNGSRSITAAAVSRGGSLVAIATDDRTVWVNDMRNPSDSGEPTAIKGLEGRTVHLTFGRDDRTLIGTGSDGDIHIWQLQENGKLVKGSVPLLLQHFPRVPHQRRLPFAKTIQSSDGTLLTSLVIPDTSYSRIGAWQLGRTGILKQLQKTTTACLDPERRKELLPGETDDQRGTRILACEQRARRVR